MKTGLKNCFHFSVDNASAPIDYDRDDWGSGWSDDDGDCINTDEVLLLNP